MMVKKSKKTLLDPYHTSAAEKQKKKMEAKWRERFDDNLLKVLGVRAK